MSVELLKEKWKTVKFNFDFTPINNNALQVSSFGNIRSVSANHGKINNLKGSDINGYKIIRLKFYKPREAPNKRKLTIQQNEIIKEETVLQELENTKKKNKTAVKEQQKKVSDLKKLLSLAYEADRKSRCVYWHSLVHRLVAEHFIKKTSKKQTIASHIDFNKNNNSAVNIAWMTKEENLAHQKNNPNIIAAFEKRKLQNPETFSSSKLKTKQVVEIKLLLAQLNKVSELAKKFKVSETQIRRIKSGENWSGISIQA